MKAPFVQFISAEILYIQILVGEIDKTFLHFHASLAPLANGSTSVQSHRPCNWTPTGNHPK